MQRINVVVADDHPLFRQGIVHQLPDHLVNQMHEADDGMQALEIVNTNPVDVVLLDIKMPVLGGYETALELRKRSKKIRIIVFTPFNEEFLVLNLIKIGVDACILKSEKSLTLCLETVLRGHFYYSRPLEHAIRKAQRSIDISLPISITMRDKKLISLLAQGQTSHEIAKLTGTTKLTIDSYRNDLLKKFKVRNATQLVSFAHQIGIL